MARKPKKPPWSAEPGRLVFPSLQGLPSVKPEPMPVTPVPPGTSALMGDMRGEPVKVEPVTYECLRCERLLDGLEPMVPEHALRCPYRGTGRDPEARG